MDKYGVAEKEEQPKRADDNAAPQKCPTCGSDLLPDANVLVCPGCGTKPFE